MPIKTANDIIKQAYNKIGIGASDRNLAGDKAQQGLDLLNAQLDNYASQSSFIAYDDTLSFPLVINQQNYTISKDTSLSPDVDGYKIVQLKFVTITFDNIQYPVDIVEDHVWFRIRRTLNLVGRPRDVYLQNEPFLTNLFFLIKPDKAYQCEIKAKFIVPNLTFTQDISTLPTYYKLFLIYELASLLVDFEPGTNWTAKSEQIHQRLKENLRSTNDIDLTSVTSSALNKRDGRYYTDYYSI
jgi:hypothetical protein